MTDNSTLNVSSGTEVFANDDIGGVKYPRAKMTWGPDGTANDTDVASGKPLPAQLRHSDGTIVTDATGMKISTTQLATLNTTAQTMAAGFQLVSLPTDSTMPGGPVAHDAVDSGNGHKQAFKATTALSGLTLVSSADRTDGFAGVDGVQIVRPHCNLEDIVTGNATNTDGTATQCIAAQSAGIKTYLVSVVLANTSATAITVDIKDGSTVKTSLPLPAGSGCIYNPPVPIPGTAATAWNFDGSAAATTVTCSMVGFKSKV